MTRCDLTREVGNGYLLKTYVSLIVFAARRMRATRGDFSNMFFIFLAPWLYVLGFKGELRTPIGRLLVTNPGILRSFTYGFLKTSFAYLHQLKNIAPSTSFFRTVVDVGANVGDFTLAIRNSAGQIVAVEPAKENFSALNANLQVNRTKNVVPVNVAASDKRKELYLQGDASNFYVGESEEGERATGMPLDLLARRLRIKDIDLMKIDVQGHELFALHGMRSLLARKFVKYLIVEVHLKRGVSADDIISFVESNGYSLINKDIYLFDQPHLYFASEPIPQNNSV